MKKESVLDVANLKTYFYLEKEKVAKAVDGVSFHVSPGETVAIVGESGSGKSITALSIMQLINKPGEIIDGTVKLHNEEIQNLTSKQITKIRGNDIGMIFQEPMTSLNPVYTIGNQIIEMLRKHKKINKQEARIKAIHLLKLVGIPRAEQVIDEYPHQLSGGMRQRVMIAMAISCDPKLLIADEPTTALDVTIQAQILDLLQEMKEKFHMAVLLITHDIGVVSEYADRIIVMYGGQIVEEGTVSELLHHTKHPYTKGLLESLPDINQDIERLGTIKGSVPPAYDFPIGCRFSTRCPYVMEECKQAIPKLTKMEENNNHAVRCYLYQEEVVKK
ncbi:MULTISPECIES: ABC transporter ATP-binding protein [Oceanobacillus]|uniref:Oligopeptide transport ATP-binding protein AppD n=1 Tax=Oceanobacillus kimchii TaxID=746691 RepID=A0ABQ5TMS6_9BACI|nr:MULTISPECIES: ABC transporter ATP-binding protein [Oceanobacillus]MBT2600738.1 ABC transporter ATP-binding protein [Oceanobacillus sp. ISL-74]MBT2650865.1 ABC transporter ATP-binding protein [Oceanobacillus sp. ISL-73]MCT1575493.1 ABC transporter ATP-binding protein [Oceanobacillus kimchii]MCT2138066.1 ABC transporter ATP-binding protein [Oceanobacillus kimchii]OEH55310.1 peptide ABC transporter ATP-binding protein [Oceanobacillus sp. E9]